MTFDFTRLKPFYQIQQGYLNFCPPSLQLIHAFQHIIIVFQMHLEKQPGFHNLEPKVFQQKIKSLNVDSSQGVQKLIEYVRQLDPQPASLRSVKKLLLKYGLAIMIYLQPFYEEFPPEDVNDNKENFKLLAGIARELTFSKKINQINFIYKFGQSECPKEIDIKEEYRNFVDLISLISELNEKVLTKKEEIQFKEYEQIIQNARKKNKFSQLMLRSIAKFSLNKSQFGQTEEQNKDQSSWGSQSHLEQESFGDFYEHQEANANETWENEIKEISYSLNSTSMGSIKLGNLCCRKYFIEEELISFSEDLRTTFSQLKYPYSESNILELKKTMCSFLNCEGGKIYIGIEKSKGGKNKVLTEIYTQAQKQQVLKSFRKIAEGIEPQIVTKKMYNVQFVPIRQKNGDYIPGANVIKVSVDFGIRDEVYSYSVDGYDYFPFRNDIQIIEKHGRQLLKFYRNIVKTPLPLPQPLHPYPCEKPDLGEPAHSHFKNYQWKNTKKKYAQGSTEVGFNSTTDASLQKQEWQAVKTAHSHAHSMTLSGKKHVMPAKKSEMSFNGAQLQKNQPAEKYCYFFVIGLDEKHLTPIFVQKKISENIKIQSTTERRLVVRVHGENEIEKTRKILKKIEAKYKEKNLKVYEMSLELEIEAKLDEALNYIKNNKLIHKVLGDKRLKFKLFRDSFRAFLELQSHKIPVRFVVPNSQQKNPNLT